MLRSARRCRRPRSAAVPVLLLAGVLLLGCEESQRGDLSAPGSCDCAPAQAVVDPALLAFLSKAKAIHLEADFAERDGDLNGAVDILERLLMSAAPGGEASPPEVREVLADTLARQAELLSTLGAFDRATQALDRGLALAVERSHYRGRLMEVLGVVEKRRHDKLLEEGDVEGAERAKARAIKALEEAVAIQDEVIRKTLGDGGAGGAEPLNP